MWKASKELKHNLAILGVILIFAGIMCMDLTVARIGIAPMGRLFSPTITFILVFILVGIGYFLVLFFHSFTLAVGSALLAFGIGRIILGEVSTEDPLLGYYYSHFKKVGYLYLYIGTSLILYSLFGRDLISSNNSNNQ